MATKNYLFVNYNEKMKIQTEDGQSYYLGKLNYLGKSTLYDDDGALVFNSCRVLSLKEGEPLKVVADGRPWTFWISSSKIISIT